MRRFARSSPSARRAEGKGQMDSLALMVLAGNHELDEKTEKWRGKGERKGRGWGGKREPLRDRFRNIQIVFISVCHFAFGIRVGNCTPNPDSPQGIILPFGGGGARPSPRPGIRRDIVHDPDTFKDKEIWDGSAESPPMRHRLRLSQPGGQTRICHRFSAVHGSQHKRESGQVAGFRGSAWEGGGGA